MKNSKKRSLALTLFSLLVFGFAATNVTEIQAKRWGRGGYRYGRGWGGRRWYGGGRYWRRPYYRRYYSYGYPYYGYGYPYGYGSGFSIGAPGFSIGFGF